MRRKIVLQEEEAKELGRRVKAKTATVRERLRAQIVLLSASGMKQERIAAEVGVSRVTVNHWCGRFVEQGIEGLEDAPGRGRKATVPADKIRRVLEEVSQPPKHLGRWSCRTMAKAAGLSKDTVQRLWSANDIKPHVSRTFKVSSDKDFSAKFWDVIGLYLNPPEKALILCCDEKSQCQALERTQPGLPLGIGHIKTRTHDYTRHGTVTLFAALNYLEGKLISRIARKHRHQEWLAFLRKIDSETPKDLAIHIIADNYATHKHPTVKAWLARHPRFHMHFTPTSSSWLNLVERFFRDLTGVLTEGSFASVRELTGTIQAFLEDRNANPRRYVWRAKGEDILRKIQSARHALQKM